jgi:hypothetical protein
VGRRLLRRLRHHRRPGRQQLCPGRAYRTMILVLAVRGLWRGGRSGRTDHLQRRP